jgi:hypothetical protein
MAKKNKNQNAPVSRKQKRGPPGPSPLLVVAGLPQATAKIAAATVTNNAGTRWRAVAGAFSNNDDAIYGSTGSITDLLFTTCAFATIGAKDADGVTNPSRIAVAYVAAEGSDRLWDGFGHAAWPLPLVKPDWDLTKRQHWRFDIETVNVLLDRALHSAETEFAETTRLRLEARRPEDVLLLPGRNFHLAQDERLAARYRAFVRGELEVGQLEAEVRVERFPYERLAKFYERTGGRGKRFAVDQRGLVFAKSHYGQHGGHHDMGASAQFSQAVLRRELEGRFRFGTPLDPPGFQHDVQREGGAELVRERFDCTDKGPIEVTADHVNVFSNDVVTARYVKKVNA